jgi:hypothetical protein
MVLVSVNRTRFCVISFGLQACPHLNIGVFDVRFAAQVTDVEMRLSRLSSLQVLRQDFSALIKIFDCTQLSHFETLSIQFYENWNTNIDGWGFAEDEHHGDMFGKPTFPIQNFVNLSSRSAFALTTLKLSHVNIICCCRHPSSPPRSSSYTSHPEHRVVLRSAHIWHASGGNTTAKKPFYQYP